MDFQYYENNDFKAAFVFKIRFFVPKLGFSHEVHVHVVHSTESPKSLKYDKKSPPDFEIFFLPLFHPATFYSISSYHLWIVMNQY